MRSLAKSVVLSLALATLTASQSMHAQVIARSGFGEGVHFLVIDQDSSVWTCGSKAADWGMPDPLGSKTPVRVDIPSGMIAVTEGRDHWFAIRSDGTVWGWGGNWHSQLGSRPGLKNRIEKVPIQITTLDDVVAIDADGDLSIALKRDGTVWTWGSTDKYIHDPEATPTQVSGLEGITAIATSTTHLMQSVTPTSSYVDLGASLYLALAEDSTVWAWNDSPYGSLGNGGNEGSQTPVKVKSLQNVIAIAASGNHALVLKKDGSVWQWGNLTYVSNRLSDPDGIWHASPTKVEGIDSAVAIACGVNHNLVLTSDSTVWYWGRFPFKKPHQYVSIPTQVKGLEDIVSITAAFNGSLALGKDGTVWKWDANDPPVKVSGVKGMIGD